MKTIPLDKGLFALCDDEDYERLLKFNWHAIKSGKTWYARAHDRVAKWTYRKVMMHRLVMSAGPGQQVDHWSMDGLDNQKANLRFVNHAQQQMNIDAKKGRKYKGVYKYGETWHAQICGKRIGRLATAEEAALAYNLAAIQRFRQYARLNQLTNIMSETNGSKELIYIVSHHHERGTSTYIVKSDHDPDEEELVAALGIDFEPEKTEWIDVVRAQELPEIVTLPPKAKAL